MQSTFVKLIFICFLYVVKGQLNNCQISGITIVTEKSGNGLPSSIVLNHLQNTNISIGNPSSQFLSCSTERTTTRPTPGGDSGEFLAALATFVSLGGNISSQANISQFLFDIISSTSFQRTFYLLTDAASLNSVSQALSSSIPNFNIYNVSSQYQSIALDEIVKPENIGCLHIKGILTNPTDYQLDSSITTSFIREFYNILWNVNSIPRPTLQISDPQIPFGAVLNVYADVSNAGRCSVAAPMITPNQGNTSLFVVHPNFVNSFRNLLSNYFSAILGISNSTFRIALDSIAASQMNQTLNRVAPGIPVYGATIRITETPTTTTGVIQGTTTGVMQTVTTTISADFSSSHHSHRKHDILVTVAIIVIVGITTGAAVGVYILYKKGSANSSNSSSRNSEAAPRREDEMVTLEEN